MEEHHEPIEPWEVNIIRVEMQVMLEHIKGKKKVGWLADYNSWVNLHREEDYLFKLECFIPKGDFWSLEKATEIVNSKSEYTPLMKGRLVEFLELTSEKGLDAAKKSKSQNTSKKYIDLLSDLNVNVLTVPSNKNGIDYLANPFSYKKPKTFVPAIPD